MDEKILIAICDNLYSKLENIEEQKVRANLSVNLCIVYALIDQKEKALNLFHYVLYHIKFFPGWSVNFGLTRLVYVSKYLESKKWISNEYSKTFSKALSKVFYAKILDRDTISLKNSTDVSIGIISILRFFSNYNPEFIKMNEINDWLCVYQKYLNNTEQVLDFGVAHGIAGTLFCLEDYRKYNTKNETVQSLIKQCTDILSENIIEVNGRVYFLGMGHMENNNEFIAGVQLNYLSWCYGTLGIFNSLSNINKKMLSKNCQELINRVILQLKKEKSYHPRDMHFCHGLAGSYYILKKKKVLSLDAELFLAKQHDHYIKTFNIENKSINKVCNHVDEFMSNLIVSSLMLNKEESKKIIEDMYFV